LLPVDVEGQRPPHLLLVATQFLRCIDESKSDEVLFWTPKDGQPAEV
jgi:hypothetical protein